jgi:site-specific recombinase XerD
MTETSRELLDSFLSYEEARGARPRGIKDIRSTVTRFLSWLDEGSLDVADLDRRVAQGYLAHLRSLTTSTGEGLAAHTIQAYAQGARRFARYLEYRELIPCNPFVGVKQPRSPKTVLRNVPTESQMEQALSLLAHWEIAGEDQRNQVRRYLTHLVAELQYASGLRIAEVADLAVEDIDLEKRRVYVRAGKKGKTRVAYLTEYVTRLLSIYINTMRPLIFTSKQDPTRLFGAGFDALAHAQNECLAALAPAIGMKLTSHSFRHALGYHLLRAGCPLRLIQEILGHEQIKDTEIYTKVDEREVQEVLDQCHPRGIRSLEHAS